MKKIPTLFLREFENHRVKNILVKQGREIVEVERTFEGIRAFLDENDIEGLVFWKDGEPQCKIKRKDFNFKWR